MTAALTRIGPALANALFRYLPILLLLALWQATSTFHWVSTAVLPPLSGVLSSGYDLVTTAEFWDNTGSSLYRGGAGLFLAIVVGGALGIAMAWWRPIRYVMSPLVEIFYPLPKSALIPVTALWLGFGDTSKILLIFLGCMLPVTIGAFNGARGAEQTLIWSARSLGASRMRTLWDVVLPSALPELLNGIRTALALSFILLVSSELIVARKGLGYLIAAVRRAENDLALPMHQYMHWWLAPVPPGLCRKFLNCYCRWCDRRRINASRKFKSLTNGARPLAKIPQPLHQPINSAFPANVCLVAVALPDGYAQVTPRGSVMVLDDETLAIWERGKGSTNAELKDGTKVTVYFRDPKLRESGMLPAGGIARFYGTAKVHKSGPMSDKIWNQLIQPEKDRDPEKKGWAISIKVDRAEDLSGKPLDIK